MIVDDEPLSHDVLKRHLSRIPEIVVTGSFYNAKEASSFIRQTNVDILLLDIEMPEINGLEFLRSLTTRPVSIVTTAYRDYALEGFELGVIDYILKPIDFERFEIAVKRATDFLNLLKLGETIDLEDRSEKYTILIKTGTKKFLIDYRTILFAQGLKDYTILTTDEKKYVVKGSIKALEDFLPKDYFIRVHKSFLIAIPQLRIVRRNKIELGSVLIPIGRNYKDRVDAILKR